MAYIAYFIFYRQALRLRSKLKAMPKRVGIGLGRCRVTPGTHFCISADEQVLTSDAISFVRSGLQIRDRCLLVGPDAFVRDVMKGVDIKGAKPKSLPPFIVVPAERYGLALLGSILSKFDGSTRSITRVIARPVWGHSAWPDRSDLLAYEAVLELVAKQHPVIWLCLHNPEADPQSMLDAHSRILVRHNLKRNPGHVPPLEFLRQLRQSSDK